MSREHSWNRHHTGFTRSHNWLEIILLILISVMIFILAYQAVTHPRRSHAMKFVYITTNSDQMKLLYNPH